MRPLLVVTLLCASLTPAFAAGDDAAQGNVTGQQSMGALVAQGFEIKAAAPGAGRFVVWLQKDKVAFACLFTTVTNAPCEQIK